MNFARPQPIAISALFDKQPPHAIEAEVGVLGSMILDPEMIAEVVAIVRAEDFHHAEHATIFRAIVETYDQTSACDLVQLQDRLRTMGVLEQIGGDEKIVGLAENVPYAASAPHYARIVADKAQLRRIIDACGKGLYAAYHPGTGDGAVREVVDQVEAAVFAATEERMTTDAVDLNGLLQEAIDTLDADKPKRGVPTGYHELDTMLCGLQPGEMCIIAARPSMGKTALALNMAEQIAAGGTTTLLFSLEMSRQAVTQRLISAASGVDSNALRSGVGVNMAAVVKACGQLTDLPLLIDDSSALSVMELRSRSRRMGRRRDIGCIVIDYLQLLTAPHAARETRQVEVSTISRGIKALAREMDVPIVCLAQLNRASEQREGNRPRMADLRESGSIEQDADVVILLHREEYYHIQDRDWAIANPDKLGMAELIVAKQRNGPTGTVDLRWDSKTTRFRNKDQAGWQG